MTKRSLIASFTALAGSLALAGGAQAAGIAGWDHSQWFGQDFLNVDSTFANVDTLAANYSELDPTNFAGAESAAFGRLFFNGMHGSTDVDESAFPPAYAPRDGSFDTQFPGLPPGFGACSVVQGEGQEFCTDTHMEALADISVVYMADLTSIAATATDWVLSFAGAASGATAVVDILFSTDGVLYTPVQAVNLIAGSPQRFDIALSTLSSAMGFVMFDFGPSGGIPQIDNVYIQGTLASVPEPGTLALLFTGLAGLVRYGRRRA